MNYDLEKTTPFLKEEGMFIKKHPSCSYKVKNIFNELINIKYFFEENNDWNIVHIITILEERITVIWDSISSVVSGIISLNIQLDLIKIIGEYLIYTSELLENISSHSLLIYFEKCSGLIKKYEELKKKSIKEKPYSKYVKPINPESLSRIEDERKKEMIQIIIESGALQYNSDTFLLRSGYRSFYFFDGSKLTHSNPLRYEDIIVKELEEKVFMLPDFSREKNKLGFAMRAQGETSGAVSMIGCISKRTGMDSLTLPPPIPDRFKDRVDGEYVKDCDSIVIVDDVVVTGQSAISHISRFEKATDKKIYAYYTNLARWVGDMPDVLSNVNFIATLTKEDLIRAQLWQPEILIVPFDSKVLPGLDLTCDYLKEICIYYGREEKYENIRGYFDELVKDTLDDPDSASDILKNYIINIYILSMNDTPKYLYELAKRIKKQ